MGKKALVLNYGDESAKVAVESALETGGVEILTDDGKDALLAADWLVLAAIDADALNDKDAEEKWSFFLDEIKWKRKSGGEVIIVDCSEISFSPSRLAYSLKKCKRYRLAQIADAVKYMSSEADGQPKPAAPKTEYASAKKAEKPAEKIVPVTPPVKKDSGACRDDHVFGKDSGYKSYVRDNDGSKCDDDHVFGKDDGYKSYVRDKDENKDDYDYVLGHDKSYVRNDDISYEYKTGDKGSEPFEEYPDIQKEIKKTVGAGKIKAIITLVIVIFFIVMFVRIGTMVGIFACTASVERLAAPVIDAVQPLTNAVKTLFYCIL